MICLRSKVKKEEKAVSSQSAASLLSAAVINSQELLQVQI